MLQRGWNHTPTPPGTNRLAVVQRRTTLKRVSTYLGEAKRIKRTLAAALKSKLAEENWSVSAFAKKIKTGRTSARRLLNSENTALTLLTMTKAAEAAGLELTLGIRKLSPKAIGRLAGKMVASNNPAEVAGLKSKIVQGFYGKSV